MIMRRLLLASILVVFCSACANTCGPDEKKKRPSESTSTSSASTAAEAGTHDGGIHGSRFAKPFSPGVANTSLPERDM